MAGRPQSIDSRRVEKNLFKLYIIRKWNDEGSPAQRFTEVLGKEIPESAFKRGRRKTFVMLWSVTEAKILGKEFGLKEYVVKNYNHEKPLTFTYKGEGFPAEELTKVLDEKFRGEVKSCVEMIEEKNGIYKGEVEVNVNDQKITQYLTILLNFTNTELGSFRVSLPKYRKKMAHLKDTCADTCADTCTNTCTDKPKRIPKKIYGKNSPDVAW